MNFLPMLAGNIVGGYLMGQNQREQRLQEQELKQQEAKLRNELIKAQVKAQEIQLKGHELKASQEERKMRLLDALLPKNQATSQPQPVAQPRSSIGFDASFDGQSGQQQSPRLPGVLAQMDPMLAAILKEATDIDIPGAQRNELDRLRYEREATQGNWVKMGMGDGSTADVWQPRFGGPAVGGGVGGYQPAKPDLRQFQKDGVTYEQPVNPYTNKPTGPAQIKEEKKPMSGEAASRTGMTLSSLDSLNRAKAILMPNGELRKDWKVIVGVGSIPGINAFLPEGREYDSYMKNALTSKIRLETGANMPVTELGNLNDRFKPSALDSDRLIKSKIDSMERFLNGTIELFDPNKQYSKETYVFKADNNQTYAWFPGSVNKSAAKDKPKKNLDSILFGK